MKGKKIGEGKYTEKWSLDGHSYVEVPKWVVEQVRGEGYVEGYKQGKFDAEMDKELPPTTNNKNQL